jgi:polyribonucleotide nucleotidyltransferase
LPESFELDTARLGKLNEIAKTHKLPKEAAEAVLALAIEQAQAQQESLAAAAEQWKAEVLKDPVLGKPESVAAVRRVVSTFGDSELTDMLNSTGMANHPAVVRFVHKVSQVLSEDAFIPSNSRGAAASQPRDPAAVLYGSPTN